MLDRKYNWQVTSMYTVSCTLIIPEKFQKENLSFGKVGWNIIEGIPLLAFMTEVNP